jgi:hypothetical protein
MREVINRIGLNRYAVFAQVDLPGLQGQCCCISEEPHSGRIPSACSIAKHGVLLAAHSILRKELVMTSLRQRMTEDMQVRNLALNTQTSYVQQVSLFARHFNKSPEELGPGCWVISTCAVRTPVRLTAPAIKAAQDACLNFIVSC